MAAKFTFAQARKLSEDRELPTLPYVSYDSCENPRIRDLTIRINDLVEQLENLYQEIERS